MSVIKTFAQALPILAAHGKDAPIPIGNKLWRIGAMQYDKGGVIALARALAAKETPVTTQPFTIDQASAQLRGLGYSVRSHGARYLVALGDAPPTPMRPEELIGLASTLDGVEAAPGWTATCGSCGQQFISDSPVQDGALCANCHPVAAPPTPEGILRAHGWVWSQERNQRDDGYRFHNTKTFEVCWYPSLQQRLDADHHAPELYERIVTGWTPPPLEGGTFTRPPGVAEYATIALGLVERGRYQPRSAFDQAEIEEMAASIREHGVINPVVVFVNERGRYELIAGERRMRAATLAGLTDVPARIIEADLPTIHELSLFENIQRANLSAIEEGRGFERIIQEMGISENALAKRLGKNRAYIQQRRSIATAAPEVVAALDSGAITFSQARAIATAAPGDEKAQEAAVMEMAELTKRGRRTTEADARQAAEKVVLAKAKAGLEVLGWMVDQGYSYTLIWAPGEKPRVWTGAEISEAVANGRKPRSAQPTAVVDPAMLKLLEFHHRVEKNKIPWIGLFKDYNEVPTFYAPSEVVPIAEQIRAEVDALIAHYAAQGWALTAEPRYSDGYFVAKGTNGGYRVIYGWKEAGQIIAQIETGEVKDEPAAATQPTAATPTYRQPSYLKCSSCKQNAPGGLRYLDNQPLCKDCAAPILAAQQAREAEAAMRIDLAIGEWLRQAPAGALPLIAGTLGGDALDEEMDAATIITHTARYFLSYLDDAGEDDDLTEDAPSVAALLGDWIATR